jgi:hypothetical protein
MTPEAYAREHFAKQAYSYALESIGIHPKAMGLYLAAYSIAKECPNTIQARRRMRQLGLPIDSLDVEPAPMGEIKDHEEGTYRVFTCKIGDSKYELLVPKDAYDLP